MELGTRLKELREAHQLSQEAVALELGVSRQAVTKWESGQSNPSTANMMALCRLYGVSLDELAALEGGAEHGAEKGRRRSGLTLYTLTAVCLALCAAWTAILFRRCSVPSAEIIGYADGPTAIYVTQRAPLGTLLALVLDPRFLYGVTFVLAILCIRRLIIRRKEKKGT